MSDKKLTQFDKGLCIALSLPSLIFAVSRGRRPYGYQISTV